MAVFENILFDIDKKTFIEILENQDRGFGFQAKIYKADLTKVQLETMYFLTRCFKKGLLGKVLIKFKTDAIGEIKGLERLVEKVEKLHNYFIISNSY